MRLLALFALVLLGLAAPAMAADRLAQTTCPISGAPVDGQNFADVEGFRVLTAGPNESEAVRRNPAAAFATLAKNRQAAQPLVWVCPIMRNPVTPSSPYVQMEGKRIYYCCRPCENQIKRDFKRAAATMKSLAGN